MAIQNATLTFALPEDAESDILALHAALAEPGPYSVVFQSAYQYGKTELKYDQLDDTMWYKIQFLNSKNGTFSSLSESVYGGTYSASAPFLAVSTTSDGANYATTQDVYDYSGLTAEDVQPSRISAALRRARAVIDFRTAEMGIERFDVYDTDTARRKYNATLRILKEAEINIALGNLYQNLSDDRIILNMRDGTGSGAGNSSIGDTSVSGDELADRNENILYLATLSSRYFAQGELLLSSLDTNSVKLTSSDLTVRFPRFKFPYWGWY